MLPRIVVVVALAAGVISPVAATAKTGGQSGAGIRLIDAPIERRDDPRAQLYIVDHVQPGARLQRRVEVSNPGAGPATFELYAGAAGVASAAFTFGDGRPGNDLTGWTTVSPAELTLGPGEQAMATVSIQVPPDAPEGERYAVVWAQAPPVPGGQLLHVSRAGVRIYLSVGRGPEPATDFTIDSVRAERRADGRPVVNAAVRNPGGRAVDLRGELELADGPGGLSAGPFPAELGTTIAPGAAGDLSVVLDPAIPPGPWRAHLILRSGSVERSASGTLTFPVQVDTDSAPVQLDTAPTGARRWAAQSTAGGLVALMAFGLVVLRRRRRRGAA